MAIVYRESVLVVEDEPVVQELIAYVLEREGYHVLTAPHGRAALEILREAPVELVLTDIRMPTMDGLELLREVRTHHPDVDIMILTGYGTIDGAVESLKLGALDYLSKPFDIGELQRRVASCFERRRQRMAERQAPTMPLTELARIVSRGTDLDRILAKVLDLISQTFLPDRARIVLVGALASHSLTLDNPVDNAAETLSDVSAEQLDALATNERPWRLADPGESDGVGAPQGLELTVPIARGEEVIGYLQIGRAAGRSRYTETEAHLLVLFASQLALATLHAEARASLHSALRGRKESGLSAAEALAEALGAFDEETREHSRRVSRYARQLAEYVGLDPHRCDVVEIAGLLHDIGKLGVGETTLHKNGSLTESERERIHQHPAQGARILAGLDSLAEVVPIVRHHHERYDGKGYPDGLHGHQIPLEARLLSVVDAFDSMTTDRPYRQALSVPVALGRLRRAAGSQFDPRLVRAWCRMLEERQSLPTAQATEEADVCETAGS